MELELKGKRVLISGSTSGIGYAVAKIFLKEGSKVYINGRSQKNIDIAIEKLKEEIPDAELYGVKADFKNPKEVDTLISQVPNVDILINNVGIYTSQSFEETSDSDWLDMFNVNVMSGVRLSRHYLPKMLKKNWGRIIFVSSECASIVPPDLIAYSTSKAALLAISRGLSQLCISSEVTVNTVLPGSTLTEGAERFLEGIAEKEAITFEEAESNFFKDVRTSSIAKRFLSPAEVAQSIVYLSSPLASATNGSTLKLDGGSIGGIM